MKFTVILEKIKASNNIEDGVLPPHLAEEYLNDSGMLDYAYFTKKHRVHGSVKDFGKAVRNVFGVVKFTTEEESTVEITKEEFLAVYKFGKFPYVRNWIPEVRKLTGKSITRDALFEYVLSTSAPSHANHGGINVIE